MKFLPFASRIFWKSWANRSVLASVGCFAAFTAISATPDKIMEFVPLLVVVGAKYVFATGGFVFGVAAPFLRIVTQDFGTDASGNQIVGAIGTAPAGTSPTPPVVVAMPDTKAPQIAPTTTPEVTQAVVGK